MTALKPWTVTEQAAVLDALIDATDYLYPKQLLLGKGQDVSVAEKMKMLILSERSQQASVAYQAPIIPSPVSPHLGLPTRRMAIGGSDSKKHGPAMDFAYRFALQDPLELSEGHAPHTELEMGHFFLRYLQQSRRLYLHDGRIVSVISKKPWDEMEKPWSWMLRFGVKDLVDTEVLEFAPYITFGAGTTLGMFHEKLLFSVFLYSEESYSSKCERSNARADLGIRPSLLFHLRPGITLQQEWTWARVLTQQKKWWRESNLTLQWTVNQRFGVQVIYHYFGTDQAQINFLRYF